MSAVMSDDAFWALIEQSHPVGEEQNERLAGVLSVLDCDQKQGFSSAFHQRSEEAYRWDVWGAAYVYGGGCSDDSFMDFRAGLIALGKTVFEDVLSNPDQLASIVEALPEDVDLFFEEFGYVPARSLSEGGCPPPAEKIKPNAHPLSAHLEGNDWDFDDEDEMQRRYPRLTALLEASEGDE